MEEVEAIVDEMVPEPSRSRPDQFDPRQDDPLTKGIDIMLMPKNQLEHLVCCRGCGIPLQTHDPNNVGYVRFTQYVRKWSQKLRRKILCSRCMELERGLLKPVIQETLGSGASAREPQELGFGGRVVPAEALTRQLRSIRLRRCLVVYILDVLDFNGSFLRNLREIVGRNPLLVVGTKIDLLPPKTEAERVREWLRFALLKKRLRVLDVRLVSSLTGKGMSAATEALLQARRGLDVFVVGTANAGKSMFVGGLLEQLEERFPQGKVEECETPLVSATPGTTLGTIPLRAFRRSATSPVFSCLYDTPGVHQPHSMQNLVPIDLYNLVQPTRGFGVHTVRPAKDVMAALSASGEPLTTQNMQAWLSRPVRYLWGYPGAAPVVAIEVAPPVLPMLQLSFVGVANLAITCEPVAGNSSEGETAGAARAAAMPAASEQPWVVAIPSLDRAANLGENTLALLLPSVPPDRIFVFADPGQVAAYREALEPLGVNVVSGEQGICAQRNAIMRHFAQGTRIVEMDDDIKAVLVASAAHKLDRSAKVRRMPAESFAAVVDRLWEAADREGCSLWGVCPMKNPFYMAATYTVGLVKSTAQLQGYVNLAEPILLTVPVMEDYERCLQLYRRHLRCMRADYLALSTVNRAKGGCAAYFAAGGPALDSLLPPPNAAKAEAGDPRWAAEASAVRVLQRRYGDLIAAAVKPKGRGSSWTIRFVGKLAEAREAPIDEAFARLLGLGAEPPAAAGGELVAAGPAPEELGCRAPEAPEEEEEPSEESCAPPPPRRDPKKRPRPSCEEGGLTLTSAVQVSGAPPPPQRDPKKRPRPSCEEGGPTLTSVVQAKLRQLPEPPLRQLELLPPGTPAEGAEQTLLRRRFVAFELRGGAVAKYCLACGWESRYLGTQRMLEHLRPLWLEAAPGGRRRHTAPCPYPLAAAELGLLKLAAAAALERCGARARSGA